MSPKPARRAAAPAPIGRVRVYFSETVTYVAELDLPPGTTTREFHEGRDPDDARGWFGLLEQQHPRWVRGEGVELSVEEREISDGETEILSGAFANETD